MDSRGSEGRALRSPRIMARATSHRAPPCEHVRYTILRSAATSGVFIARLLADDRRLAIASIATLLSLAAVGSVAAQGQPHALTTLPIGTPRTRSWPRSNVAGAGRHASRRIGRSWSATCSERSRGFRPTRNAVVRSRRHSRLGFGGTQADAARRGRVAIWRRPSANRSPTRWTRFVSAGERRFVARRSPAASSSRCGPALGRADQGTPPVVAEGRARLGWSSSPHLVVVGELYGQTSRRNDPTVRQRAFRNTSGVVDFGETYANASLGRLDVSFGRSWASWIGEDTESIALSANGPLVDRLELGLRWRVAEVRAIIASVNDVTMTPEPRQPCRGHARDPFSSLALRPRPHHQAERSSSSSHVGETILSSRTTGGLDLAYANPVMAYRHHSERHRPRQFRYTQQPRRLRRRRINVRFRRDQLPRPRRTVSRWQTLHPQRREDVDHQRRLR